MWEKILAQLVSKNPGVSKAVLTLLAKKLADKVTEESQIEGAISDFEANSPMTIKEYADFVQAEGDKRVTEALKKKDEPTPPTPPKPKDDQPDDMPPWAKKLQDTVTVLGQELTKKKTESTLEQFVAKAKEKGVPEAFARKTLISEDFDIESSLAAVEAEWSSIKQVELNSKVVGEKTVSGVKTTEKEVSSAIADFAKSNIEAANAAKN